MWCDLLKKLLVVSIVLFFIFSSVPIVKCANAEDEVKSDFPATGFFYVDEDEDGVWWFVTPTGEKFYSVGVQSVEPNELCYVDIWASSKLCSIWEKYTSDSRSARWCQGKG